MLPQDVCCQLLVRIEHDQVFTALFIWDCGDNAEDISEDLVDGFFHPQVWDHLATDFAETGEAVGDANEPILIDRGDVSGNVPPVTHHLRCLFWLPQVPAHAVGTFHQQQPFLPRGKWFPRLTIHDFGRNPWKRMADRPRLITDLAWL